ncbi:MAG: sel1 repeat family protein [Zoogloeaceae bacterium]|nr:sel1 repeat family protein [Zoogloeaceae bacterium]
MRKPSAKIFWILSFLFLLFGCATQKQDNHVEEFEIELTDVFSPVLTPEENRQFLEEGLQGIEIEGYYLPSKMVEGVNYTRSKNCGCRGSHRVEGIGVYLPGICCSTIEKTVKIKHVPAKISSMEDNKIRFSLPVAQEGYYVLSHLHISLPSANIVKNVGTRDYGDTFDRIIGLTLQPNSEATRYVRVGKTPMDLDDNRFNATEPFNELQAFNWMVFKVSLVKNGQPQSMPILGEFYNFEEGYNYWTDFSTGGHVRNYVNNSALDVDDRPRSIARLPFLNNGVCGPDINIDIPLEGWDDKIVRFYGKYEKINAMGALCFNGATVLNRDGGDDYYVTSQEGWFTWNGGLLKVFGEPRYIKECDFAYSVEFGTQEKRYFRKRLNGSYDRYSVEELGTVLDNYERDMEERTQTKPIERAACKRQLTFARRTLTASKEELSKKYETYYTLIAGDQKANADVLKENLKFTCTYEKDNVPERNSDADKIFRYARWLELKNKANEYRLQIPALLEDESNPLFRQDNTAEVERLYRIATAWGHDRASHHLALMLRSRDEQDLPVTLAQALMSRNIPQGYYDMGVLLQNGDGVVADRKSALKHFRKAAELGNPEAQYEVGTKLRKLTRAEPVPFRIGDEMRRCAAEQGHGKAALEIAEELKEEGNFADALKYFQLAVKAGNHEAAGSLKFAFLAPTSGQPHRLGLVKDEERSRRYEVISGSLRGGYSDAGIADEVDEIVPLPPASLPPWDERLKWIENWESNVPPPLPGKERIVEMARAKGLDPVSGQPVKRE